MKFELIEIADGQERLDVAERFFSNVRDFLTFEQGCYQMMGKATDGKYSGGFWKFYELRATSEEDETVASEFVMLFDGDDDEEVPLVCSDNYCEEVTTWKGASWAVNAAIINYLAHFAYEQGRDFEKYSDRYHAMLQASDSSFGLLTKDESMSFLRFID